MVLTALRSLYSRLHGRRPLLRPECIRDPDEVARLIGALLERDAPAMIARFGSSELQCLVTHAAISSAHHPLLEFIRGTDPAWWWDPKLLRRMNRNAGFFPPTEAALEHFCELMLQDLPLVDLLGSWLPDERMFDQVLAGVPKVDLELLNPYFARRPWTHALAGRKVLVIHPFARTIESQYRRRELLFADDLLPEFQLRTIKAVQSIAGEKTPFASWFDALQWMKDAMDEQDYDICLVGCGAYGFPLVAHARRRGRKGIHLGGSLQLLFGIRGNRWESTQYSGEYDYARLMNEHWVRPAEEERPRRASEVEEACYW